MLEFRNKGIEFACGCQSDEETKERVEVYTNHGAKGEQRRGIRGVLEGLLKHL